MQYASPRCPFLWRDFTLEWTAASNQGATAGQGEEIFYLGEMQGHRTRLEVEHSYNTSYVSIGSPGCFIQRKIFPDDMCGLS